MLTSHSLVDTQHSPSRHRQTAARLESLGIVNRVVPNADLIATAMDLANRIAGKSRFATGKLLHETAVL